MTPLRGRKRTDIFQGIKRPSYGVGGKVHFFIELFESDSDPYKIPLPVGEKVNRNAAFDSSKRFRCQVDKTPPEIAQKETSSRER